MTTTAALAEQLFTPRDFLRYAVSLFRRENLSFGHGATNALDEAAYIILEGLNLPIDDINPWLDARLTLDERDRLAGLVTRRAEDRVPAAYLLNKAYIQGAAFYVDKRVIVPRSYIGELIGDDLFENDAFEDLPDPEDVEEVLELCTGSGCLAILAALTFPNAKVTAVDLSSDALAVARRNVDDHALSDAIDLLEGDLFAPVEGRQFDLIIANPPYVDAEAMAALPKEYRAEPDIALAGGEDGLDIVRRLLDGAADFLTPEGGLLCEIGTGREILEEDYPHLNFFWLDSEQSEGEVFWLAAADFDEDA